MGLLVVIMEVATGRGIGLGGVRVIVMVREGGYPCQSRCLQGITLKDRARIRTNKAPTPATTTTTATVPTAPTPPNPNLNLNCNPTPATPPTPPSKVTLCPNQLPSDRSTTRTRIQALQTVPGTGWQRGYRGVNLIRIMSVSLLVEGEEEGGLGHRHLGVVLAAGVA